MEMNGEGTGEGGKLDGNRGRMTNCDMKGGI